MDKVLITDIAANVYWRLVDRDGKLDSNDKISKTNGMYLLKDSLLVDVLSRYNQINIDDMDDVVIAVIKLIVDSVKNEFNIIGAVYADDFIKGRSANIKSLDTSMVQFIPQNIIIDNNIETIGMLCVRHPLPSVVFSSHAPINNFIKIADTTHALGFDMPLFFNIESTKKAQDDLYVSMGTVHIFVPNVTVGNAWHHIIQNSICSIKYISACDALHDVKINAVW